jgi:hypothetical protein
MRDLAAFLAFLPVVIGAEFGTHAVLPDFLANVAATVVIAGAFGAGAWLVGKLAPNAGRE